jgi:hypothetical protein
VRTTRPCTACARVRRSLRKATSMYRRHMVFIDAINANSYILAHSYMEDRITDACVRHRRAHVSGSVLVHARVGGGFGYPISCARPFGHLVSVSTACGSAHRSSTKRQCSTRTSARGTPHQCPTLIRYAPLSAGGAPPLASRTTPSASLRCGATSCVRRHRRCARACAHV